MRGKIVRRKFGLAFVVTFVGHLLTASDASAQNFNTANVAAQDGFVSATASTGSCLGKGTQFPYQTLHGYRNGTDMAYEEDWGDARNISIFYPVKKGDTWKVDIFCSGAAAALKFTPIGSDVVGAATKKSFNTQYTANKPGFVIASGYTGSCKGVNSAYTYQQLTASTGRHSVASEATWGEWRAVSFAFPVMKSENWSVNAFCPPPYNTKNGATADLYFVELANVQNAYTSVSPVAANQAFSPPRDGILLASGWTGRCVKAGWTNQLLNVTENGSTLATEQAWGEWRQVSATVPVKSGRQYKANFFCTDSATHAGAVFIANDFAQGACADKKDNDNDGLIDLADPGCSGPTDGDERDPNGPACDNGKDDDGDKVIDYPQDSGCDSPQDTTETAPANAECDDGKDNDKDGLRDFTFDPGCYSPFDPSERDAGGPQCDNGWDDDGDGLIDYPNDNGCSGPTDPTEGSSSPTPECSDKKDNDYDGFIDYPKDSGCTSKSDTSERDPSCAACDDGIDNDRDGETDYPNDSGCESSTDETEYTEGGEQCDNGIDDDDDGLIDYPLDLECDDSEDCTENECVDKESGSLCKDGIDNDCDGDIDADDKDCKKKK